MDLLLSVHELILLLLDDLIHIGLQEEQGIMLAQVGGGWYINVLGTILIGSDHGRTGDQRGILNERKLYGPVILEGTVGACDQVIVGTDLTHIVNGTEVKGLSTLGKDLGLYTAGDGAGLCRQHG